jgi:hypothetical protein
MEAGAKAEAPANKRAKTVLRIMVDIIRLCNTLESDFFREESEVHSNKRTQR